MEEQEEEARDDFEGFGSITELAKNKDALVDKKLKDKEFIAQVESEEKKKKELIESVKRAKENKEKAEKVKKALSKKQTIANAKAKIAAALDKATKKKAQVAPSPTI